MSFEQATIKVEKEAEFGELKDAINRCFVAEKVEQFLKQVKSGGLRVRDLQGVLAKRVLDRVDSTLAKSGRTSQGLYEALTPSDQGQMRELYLFKVEEVSQELRARFQKLFQYY